MWRSARLRAACRCEAIVLGRDGRAASARVGAILAAARGA
ncbi:hypothetical protein BURPSPAST_T0396 [Burkholderia pseudomallei Pasteur 52237]|nr:hypothetical protein BURPSPAST_T0396 [Burkholderia pseudomallei Pasteur 52237]